MLLDEKTVQAIEQFRKSAGLSQRALGEMVGASTKTVNRWLNGKARFIKPEIYGRLAKYIDKEGCTAGHSPFVRYVVSNWDCLEPEKQNIIMEWILEAKEREKAIDTVEASKVKS
jgi:transcriptional regulator with XRE-family HTH domain